ncbi:Protein of unknown function [Gryllus bimaculatus]|nr:Protein of unknown function [Gryllus bimaculatus]
MRAVQRGAFAATRARRRKENGDARGWRGSPELARAARQRADSITWESAARACAPGLPAARAAPRPPAGCGVRAASTAHVAAELHRLSADAGRPMEKKHTRRPRPREQPVLEGIGTGKNMLVFGLANNGRQAEQVFLRVKCNEIFLH